MASIGSVRPAARAKIATERVRELIEGKEVVIQTKKTGKFGRWLADIYLPDEPDRTVNQLLLEEGLAAHPASLNVG